MNEVVVTKGEEIQVTAAQPAEMVQAQSALIEWCSRKIASIRSEMNELQEELDIATKNKWRTAAFKRMLSISKGRIIFYGKVQKALRLGYCIVPNFPVSAFAIRTDKNKPQGTVTFASYENFEQHPDATLLEGQGTYQNPFPVLYQRSIQDVEGGKTVTKKEYWPALWREMEFPLSMAKPQIMSVTEAAMKLNLFDQLAMCPAEPGRVDPMIIGQIIEPSRRYPRERKRVSFLVAWYLDTSVL